MRFRPRQRLRRQADFVATRKEGRRQFGAAFVFSVRRRPPGSRFDLPRLGIVASRRVGPSVTRNLIKRRVREIFRENQALFPGDADIVIVLQPKAAAASFEDLRRQFLEAARRCGFGTAPGAGRAQTPAASPDTEDGGPG
jgi:ribonuclease P protein component